MPRHFMFVSASPWQEQGVGAVVLAAQLWLVSTLLVVLGVKRTLSTAEQVQAPAASMRIASLRRTYV